MAVTNVVTLVGRLSKAPTIEAAKEGSLSIMKLGLLVKSYDGKKDDFYFLKRFGPNAIFSNDNLRSGDKVVVIGKMNSINYVDGHGKRVYGVEVIVDFIGFDLDQVFANNFTRNDMKRTCTPTIVGGTNVKMEPTNNGSKVYGKMTIPDNIDAMIG